MTTYVTDGEGKFIPATQRPDGTWRKARRVKEGYVPQEEVPLYESKGKQFANRKPDYPPGMSPTATANSKKEKAKKKKTTPGIIVLPKNASNSTVNATNSVKESSNKNSVSTNSAPKEVGTVPFEQQQAASATVKSITKDLSSLNFEDPHLELSKKVKKLKKKIREIEAIESKLKEGDLKKPEKDQLDKVKRKKEYLKELKELEAQINTTD